VWSNDPESYAGGRVTTGRVSLAGEVRLIGVPWFSRLGVGREAYDLTP
jgi:hypothetical protein